MGKFVREHSLPKHYFTLIKLHFIPFCEEIYQLANNKNNLPFFVGVNGCQGSGKTTLSQFMKRYLFFKYQTRVVATSLDDFYLSKNERKQLAVNVHPLFETRGVPGTHDTVLFSKTLVLLNKNNAVNEPFKIPRFDKATDEPCGVNQWKVINEPVDIVIVEGWCWGVNAQPSEKLSKAVNSLELEEDSQSLWRQAVNRFLKQQYQPLYSAMNYWLYIKAPSFEHVFQWRLEQERKLIFKTKKSAKTCLPKEIMNETQVARFILFFQRLTEHAFMTMPTEADKVFELDCNRNILSDR
ncbi:kinase [Litorilituus lipolyticus]|uniref:Kinase n=1 Tax=Litorilituus lipolyticus TaxID=2491017 RepID=A0A502L1M8_9GAMM|nr:kinase [Litorilituus lipolyticus]